MGLDLYHIQAIRHPTPPDKPWLAEVVLETDYDGFDVPISYFAGCLQEVTYGVGAATVILPHTAADVAYALDWFKTGDRHVLTATLPGERAAALAALIIRLDLQDLPQEETRTDRWTAVTFYTLQQARGFYTETVGEQRKGMNAAFYERFCRRDIWAFTGKSNFDFALSCVDTYWENDTPEIIARRREAFRQDFTDKWADGHSILWVSC